METINVEGGEELLSKTKIHTPQGRHSCWEYTFLHMQAFSMFLQAITAQQSLDKQKTLLLGGKAEAWEPTAGLLARAPREIYLQGPTETHREKLSS